MWQTSIEEKVRHQNNIFFMTEICVLCLLKLKINRWHCKHENLHERLKVTIFEGTKHEQELLSNEDLWFTGSSFNFGWIRKHEVKNFVKKHVGFFRVSFFYLKQQTWGIFCLFFLLKLSSFNFRFCYLIYFTSTDILKQIQNKFTMLDKNYDL